ncbi:type I toxin-antitoxin system SymE family toxin [Stenotrophomonas sp. Marseille-Q5258]|uniref:type I toxin-antitoxin system SymE family toxin n=1 Tax=Stenotrophomonas sp. Marseille-Q5258 TaxID=2972779 RepID=UPI0021C84B3B|nr:type I toxin-antitoxin system SymE family toxin [Stenotrophomonas sp. Marseille-Q5258]
MLTSFIELPVTESPVIERPRRKPSIRPARSNRVGSLMYATREDYGRNEIVPYIRLRGRWLGSLGFDIGALLKVEATHGSITLTVVERPVVVPPKVPRKLQRQAR